MATLLIVFLFSHGQYMREYIKSIDDGIDDGRLRVEVMVNRAEDGYVD